MRHKHVVRTREEYKEFRSKLLKRRPWCYYCHTSLTESSATLDHRTPRSRGGTDEKNNLVLCCEGCNNAKGSLTAREFLHAIRTPDL